MTNFIPVAENICRITVPYKDIYTSVFFLKAPGGWVLFDTAANTEDADTYILPALAELGIVGNALKYIFISHNHNDHAGGLERLKQEFPGACVVTRNEKLREKFGEYGFFSPEDGDLLLETFRVVSIPGHTIDSAALLDTRTGTLVTGDCLQVYGIYGMGKWGACIRCIPEHLEAVEKLRGMELTTVAMAHDYHPFGNIVRGEDEIRRCLDGCGEALRRVQKTVCAHPELDDEAVAELYNRDSGLPKVPAFVPAAIRSAMAAGRL